MVCRIDRLQLLGMFCCESPTLVEWHPPPHGNQPPLWTKLIANGVMLSNSIEYANSRASPVYPIVCESCWCPSADRRLR